MVKLALMTIWVILVFIVFIAVLVYTLLKIYQMLRKVPPKKKKMVPDIAVEKMEEIVQDKKSTADQLVAVIKALAAHHQIPPKKGDKPDKVAKRYLDIIFTMASHNNMTVELQDEMYDILSEANPSYTREFSRARRKS